MENKEELIPEEMDDTLSLAIITLIVLIIAGLIFWFYVPKASGSLDPEKTRVNDALTKMRRLWTERAYLSRATNVEDLVGYNGSGATAERFINNANQLGRNFGELYGSNAGNSLAELLRNQHILMVDLVKAAKQHRSLTDLESSLEQNQNELTNFLCALNKKMESSQLNRLFNAQSRAFRSTLQATIQGNLVTAMSHFDSYNKTTQDLMDYLDSHIWHHLIGQQRQSGSSINRSP